MIYRMKAGRREERLTIKDKQGEMALRGRRGGEMYHSPVLGNRHRTTENTKVEDRMALRDPRGERHGPGWEIYPQRTQMNAEDGTGRLPCGAGRRFLLTGFIRAEAGLEEPAG